MPLLERHPHASVDNALAPVRALDESVARPAARSLVLEVERGDRTAYLLVASVHAVVHHAFAEKPHEEDVRAFRGEQAHRLPHRQQLAGRADHDRAADAPLAHRRDDLAYSGGYVLGARRGGEGGHLGNGGDLRPASVEALEVQHVRARVEPLREQFGDERGDEASAGRPRARRVVRRMHAVAAERRRSVEVEFPVHRRDVGRRAGADLAAESAGGALRHVYLRNEESVAVDFPYRARRADARAGAAADAESVLDCG